MKITKKFEAKLKLYLDKHALRLNKDSISYIEKNVDKDVEKDVENEEINTDNTLDSEYETISDTGSDVSDSLSADIGDEDENNKWAKYKDKYFFYYKIVSKKRSFF